MKKENMFWWWALRIGFWVTIVAFFSQIWMPDSVYILYVVIALIVFTFIASIVNLVKYEKMIFALTVLILTGLLMVMIFVGILVIAFRPELLYGA